MKNPLPHPKRHSRWRKRLSTLWWKYWKKFPAPVQCRSRGKCTQMFQFTRYCMKSGANHTEGKVYSYVRLCGQYIQLRPVSGSKFRFCDFFFFSLIAVFDGHLFRISSAETLMWSLFQWQKYLQNNYTSIKKIFEIHPQYSQYKISTHLTTDSTF